MSSIRIRCLDLEDGPLLTNDLHQTACRRVWSCHDPDGIGGLDLASSIDNCGLDGKGAPEAFYRLLVALWHNLEAHEHDGYCQPDE